MSTAPENKRTVRLLRGSRSLDLRYRQIFIQRDMRPLLRIHKRHHQNVSAAKIVSINISAFKLKMIGAWYFMS